VISTVTNWAARLVGAHILQVDCGPGGVDSDLAGLGIQEAGHSTSRATSGSSPVFTPLPTVKVGSRWSGNPCKSSGGRSWTRTRDLFLIREANRLWTLPECRNLQVRTRFRRRPQVATERDPDSSGFHQASMLFGPAPVPVRDSRSTIATMVADDSDWRLIGQETYLQGAQLIWKRYRA
jgi:hypothetical protein